MTEQHERLAEVAALLGWIRTPDLDAVAGHLEVEPSDLEGRAGAFSCSTPGPLPDDCLWGVSVDWGAGMNRPEVEAAIARKDEIYSLHLTLELRSLLEKYRIDSGDMMDVGDSLTVSMTNLSFGSQGEPPPAQETEVLLRLLGDLAGQFETVT